MAHLQDEHQDDDAGRARQLGASRHCALRREPGLRILTRVPEMSPNHHHHQQPDDRRQQQPANMKVTRVLNPRTHGNNLVMRSSAAPLPILGPDGRAIRVGLPPDNLG